MEDNEFNKFEETSSPVLMETVSIQGGTVGNVPVTSKGATAAFVLGIISLIGTFFWVIHIFPLWIMPYIGLFLGISAAKRFKGEERIKSKAKAGIVMCGISIGLILITLILCIIGCVMLVNSFGDGTDFINGLNSFMNELIAEVKLADPITYEQLYNEYYADYPEWFAGISALLGMF